jgi:hypothetical protein
MHRGTRRSGHLRRVFAQAHAGEVGQEIFFCVAFASGGFLHEHRDGVAGVLLRRENFAEHPGVVARRHCLENELLERMKKRSAQRGRPAIDVIEDAVHLLRTSPLSVLLTYYTGAIPFALGLLYFWADMSRGAFAHRRCAVASLGMALLYLWLKCWQAVFASKLRERLSAAPVSKWTARRVLNLVLVQGVIQPSRLIVQPIATVLTIPFGWVSAFYESVTAVGDGNQGQVRSVYKSAAIQARLWPAQNHMLLLILSLLAFFLWLNAAIAIVSIPQLMQMFLGIETTFTRAGIWIIWNTTFLAATVTLAWLALDPLVKTIYAVRCFHGAATKDGADLLAELARIRSSKPLAIAALLMLMFFAMPGHAAEKSPSQQSVQAPQLDDAIKRTLKHDKYAWRMPRETIVDEPESATKSWMRAFFESIGEMIMNWMRALRDVIRHVIEWIDKFFSRKYKADDSPKGTSTDWMLYLRGFAYLLLALAAVALVWLLFRLWRQAARVSKVVRAQVIAAKPDLTDEHVTAAQLPEDEWLKLGREMIEKGELRLALRAFYLASLAHLATREIVSIAQFKSNRDYEREVNRRARALADLRSAFSENVGSFERVWYGLYDVTGESLARFQANLERIRAC